MPKEYDLTLCYNVRAYSKAVIEAESFDDAKAKARTYWKTCSTVDWLDTDYGEDAEAHESVICVDDIDGKQDDEILDPDYVYRNDLLAFASKVAALSLAREVVPADADDAYLESSGHLESNHQALEALIIEARKVLGIK